jgi:hypothetical protein
MVLRGTENPSTFPPKCFLVTIGGVDGFSQQAVNATDVCLDPVSIVSL